jgi:hypothetical protein
MSVAAAAAMLAPPPQPAALPSGPNRISVGAAAAVRAPPPRPAALPSRPKRMSVGAAAAVRAPPPRPAALPADEVELSSMPRAMPVPTSIDSKPGNRQPRPRPRSSQARRRSGDARDEMLLFGSCGSREQPPSHRASGRVKEIHQQTNTASQFSEGHSRASVVGRVRADSLADEPEACWVPMSSSSAPGAPEAGAARADRPTGRADSSRASVVGRARADSLADEPVSPKYAGWQCARRRQRLVPPSREPHTQADSRAKSIGSAE